MTNLTLEEIGRRARAAEVALRVLPTLQKNKVLTTSADYLLENKKILLEANEKDIELAKTNQMPEALKDRLLLTEKRIAQMAEGLRQIAELEDPVGEVLSMKQRPNGLLIGQKRVPLGVIGIIYESRPNVTADAFGLCFKAGNAVVLRGGKDAINSNQAIAGILQKALISCQLPADAILLITDTSHETAEEFMRLNRYIDVLIPRGGAGLIRTVVEHATVPVIETGTGNCHVYVDETADLAMAADIIFNAKTQRIGVCNACESLVIHEKVKDALLPLLVRKMKEKNVELRGDEASRRVCPEIMPACEEDWGTEYLDYILSIKTVKNIEEAIAHINHYNTGHSEAIITRDYENSRKFLDQIDAAAVYVNASTRFTDGFEFGFGGEIGISTQKLHARGPMGLKELTSTKYIIYGNGQVRP
ncbi:glutamate-5-semialdehyde dehydrogenase [Lachnospiraceae bacterium]|nr:glutamate-5-semialdehyde dehydrogenase [Lachnospiraceae bacterium]